MPINRRSVLLNELKRIKPKTNNGKHVYDLDKRHLVLDYKHSPSNPIGKPISLNSLSAIKEGYKRLIQIQKQKNKQLILDMETANKLLREEGIPTTREKPREYNQAIREKLVKSISEHAEHEQKELNIKIKQILDKTKSSRQLLEQYNRLQDILISKINSQFRTRGKLIDPRGEIFKRNALREITTILENTNPNNIPTALNRIQLIIINW